MEPTKGQQFRLEELETRLLLSADPSLMGVDGPSLDPTLDANLEMEVVVSDTLNQPDLTPKTEPYWGDFSSESDDFLTSLDDLESGPHSSGEDSDSEAHGSDESAPQISSSLERDSVETIQKGSDNAELSDLPPDARMETKSEHDEAENDSSSVKEASELGWSQHQLSASEFSDPALPKDLSNDLQSVMVDQLLMSLNSANGPPENENGPFSQQFSDFTREGSDDSFKTIQISGLQALNTVPPTHDAANQNRSSDTDFGRSSPLNSDSTFPELPGLILRDTDARNYSGQVVYLDIDGAQALSYGGPVTIPHLDVPAFRAPAELNVSEEWIIQELIQRLNQQFSEMGVRFVDTQPASESGFSTLYLGGDDDVFRPYGFFLGLAEKVDVGNVDRSDVAWVFTDNLLSIDSSLGDYLESLQLVAAHETGRLLGYENVRPIDEDDLNRFPLHGVAAAVDKEGDDGDNTLETDKGQDNVIIGKKGDDKYVYESG